MKLKIPANRANEAIQKLIGMKQFNLPDSPVTNQMIIDYGYQDFATQALDIGAIGASDVKVEYKTKPFSYQEDSVKHAYGMPGYYMALPIGLGKTKAVIDLISTYKANQEFKTVLVICPKSVTTTWLNQLKEHCKCDYTAFRPSKGNADRKANEIKQAIRVNSVTDKVLIIIINFEMVWRGSLGKLFKKLSLDMVVYDEIHRLKGRTTAISKYALSLKARYSIGMSGTPGRVDKWLGQYRSLDRAIFGSVYQAYVARYLSTMVYYGREELKKDSNGNLIISDEKDLMRRFNLATYTVKIDDIPDLPGKINSEFWVELSLEEKRAYDKMNKEFTIMIDNNEVSASNVLSKGMKLRQITSGFIKNEGETFQFGESKKEALKEILEDTDERVLVFYTFNGEREQIEDMARTLGRPYAEMSGRVNNFDGNLEDGAVIAIQYKSGAAGIDGLQRLCNVAVAYNLTWSSEDFQQAMGRLHRTGQKNKVIIHYIAAVGTRDAEILKALKSDYDYADILLKRRD